MEEQLKIKKGEYKLKQAAIKRQKKQIEGLKKVVEKKTRQIDELLKEKRELLEEREQHVDEIFYLQRKSSEPFTRFKSVLEPSPGYQSDYIRHESEIVTPDIPFKTPTKLKHGVSKMNINLNKDSLHPGLYPSSMKTANKNFPKAKLNQALYSPSKELRTIKSSQKLLEEFSPPQKFHRIHRRSITPRSFFDTKMGNIYNPLRSSPSKNSMIHNMDSSNLLSGNQSIYHRDTFPSLAGRNCSKGRSTFEAHTSEDPFEVADDESLLKLRLSEFERQLLDSRKEKLKAEQQLYNTKKVLMDKERAIETQIATITERLCKQKQKSFLGGTLKDYSDANNLTRNRSIKLEPKVLRDTFIDKIDTPRDSIDITEKAELESLRKQLSKNQKQRC